MCLSLIMEFPMKLLVAICINYQLILGWIPGPCLSDTQLQGSA